MKRQRNGLKVSNILVIGGSDPCSGAGIQADIKTLSLLGFHSFSVYIITVLFTLDNEIRESIII